MPRRLPNANITSIKNWIEKGELRERGDEYSEALRQAGCKLVVHPADDTELVIEALRRALL